jgi:hypothetical protein
MHKPSSPGNALVAANHVALACLLVFAFVPGAQAAAPSKCHKLGDTITVRGRVAANVNGGTYLELIESVCANYPTPKNTTAASHLTTLGQRVPPGRYMQVTGTLKDSYARGEVGLDIGVASYTDIDAEVRQAIDGEFAKCKQWQDQASATLSARTHGATVNPIAGNSGGLAPKCGIWAVDTQAPHDSITVWRPGGPQAARQPGADRKR